MSEIGTDSDLYSDTDFGAEHCESICATSTATSGAAYKDDMDEAVSISVGRKFMEGDKHMTPRGGFGIDKERSGSLTFGARNRVGTPGVAVGSRSQAKSNPLSVVSSRATSPARSPSLSDSIDEERVDIKQIITFKTGIHSFIVKTFRDVRGAHHQRPYTDGSCVLLGVGMDGLGSAYAVARLPIAENDGDLRSGVSSDGHLAPTVVRILRQRMQTLVKMHSTRNALPQYGATLHKGALYCASHFAYGGSLADFAIRNMKLTQSPLVRVPEDFVRFVLRHVLRGVMRLHEAGLVHGAISVRSVYFDVASGHRRVEDDDDDESTAIIAMIGGFADYILEYRPSLTNSPSRYSPSSAGKAASTDSPMSWVNGRKGSNSISPRQLSLLPGAGRAAPIGVLPSAFLVGTFGAHDSDQHPPSPNMSSGGGSNSYSTVYDDSDAQANTFVTQLARALSADLTAVARLADAMLQGFTGDGAFDERSAANADESAESDVCPSTLQWSKGAFEFLDQLSEVTDELARMTASSVLMKKTRLTGTTATTTRDVAQAMYAASAKKIKSELINHRFLTARRAVGAPTNGGTTSKAKSKQAAAAQYVIVEPEREIESFANTQRKNIALECVTERNGAASGGGRTTSFRLGSAANLMAPKSVAASAQRKVSPGPVSLTALKQQQTAPMPSYAPIQASSPNVAQRGVALDAGIQKVGLVGRGEIGGTLPNQPLTGRSRVVMPPGVSQSGPATARRSLQQL